MAQGLAVCIKPGALGNFSPDHLDLIRFRKPINHNTLKLRNLFSARYLDSFFFPSIGAK